MSTPTLDRPPLQNGLPSEVPVEHEPRGGAALMRRVGLVAVLVAAITSAAITGVLLALGAVGGTTTSTTAASSGATAAALNPTAVYAGAVAGVVDITATGVTPAPGAMPFSPPGRSVSATGTGFLVDTRGDIVTASHVVAGASSITIKLEGGTRRTARVLGVDRSTDIAVLKIDPSGLKLHALPLASSQALAVGNPLAVVGDPFQYDRSLSTGVVSALDRTIQAPNGFLVAHAIQTDATINPGNSGGPVLDAGGGVVGVVDQIATGSSSVDSSTGVGFAVPSDVVKAELSQLERGRPVTHAYLGAGTAQATTEQGALVQTVAPGTPAARAGLRPGDLVTAIGGTVIKGPNALVATIAALRPGDRITLEVLRGSTTVTLTATLVAQPSQAPAG
jgi:putative serine protease PepD